MALTDDNTTDEKTETRSADGWSVSQKVLILWGPDNPSVQDEENTIGTACSLRFLHLEAILILLPGSPLWFLYWEDPQFQSHPWLQR